MHDISCFNPDCFIPYPDGDCDRTIVPSAIAVQWSMAVLHAHGISAPEPLVDLEALIFIEDQLLKREERVVSVTPSHELIQRGKAAVEDKRAGARLIIDAMRTEDNDLRRAKVLIGQLMFNIASRAIHVYAYMSNLKGVRRSKYLRVVHKEVRRCA